MVPFMRMERILGLSNYCTGERRPQLRQERLGNWNALRHLLVSSRSWLARQNRPSIPPTSSCGTNRNSGSIRCFSHCGSRNRHACWSEREPSLRRRRTCSFQWYTTERQAISQSHRRLRKCASIFLEFKDSSSKRAIKARSSSLALMHSPCQLTWRARCRRVSVCRFFHRHQRSPCPAKRQPARQVRLVSSKLLRYPRLPSRSRATTIVCNFTSHHLPTTMGRWWSNFVFGTRWRCFRSIASVAILWHATQSHLLRLLLFLLLLSIITFVLWEERPTGFKWSIRPKLAFFCQSISSLCA